ncbi:MAG: hypothetical protein EVA39_04450 [Flavobacteriales bacterium]|nr:hypothetical protein [Flavobacteriaceae bacterium]RZP08366.1 MAG: hypothetical protein EVA39_04450 [Flavobacteriales bacterium]
MKKQVFLFKGSFIETKRLEFELNSNNINPIIVNNKRSALLSGFGYNPNENIIIYVFEDQLEKSKTILQSLTI